MKRCLAALGLVIVCAACDRHNSPSLPTAPSPAPQAAPQPAPPPTPQTLVGYVGDTAFRTLDGVQVEVLQGPQAGTVVMSDASGRFSYEGTFATPVTLRASKDGFETGTQPVRVLNDGRAYVSFQLATLAAPAPLVAGTYTLTISADDSCTALPDDVRTRSYTATVTAGSGRVPANTYFNGIATGGQFAPYSNVFWIGVAGDYVAISTAGEGPSLVEQVGPNRYVAYYGTAGVTVGPSGVSTATGPFRGTIEYCELKAPIGQYYDCSPELAAVREECPSEHSQLTLSRR